MAYNMLEEKAKDRMASACAEVQIEKIQWLYDCGFRAACAIYSDGIRIGNSGFGDWTWTDFL